MEGTSRDDIRSLLKSFGIQADEAIVSHLARHPGEDPLHLRLTLQDLTEYGDESPSEPLQFELEGTIGR